jgi:predicted nucleic acid-binding protein
VIEQERGDLIIPDAILAEIDYLLRNRLGVSAELDFLEELLAGTYTLYRLDSQDFLRCQELLSRYRNLNLGLADTSVMATAERLNTYRVLTLDERDFRAVRLKKPLVILPADV